MQNHGPSEAMQAAMSRFGPLVAGPPQMTVTTPVAAFWPIRRLSRDSQTVV